MVDMYPPLVVKQLYYGALDMGGGICSCDICSPYITILLNNGTVGVLELTATTEGEGSQRESAPVTLKLSWPEIEMVCKFVSQACLHTSREDCA